MSDTTLAIIIVIAILIFMPEVIEVIFKAIFYIGIAGALFWAITTIFS